MLRKSLFFTAAVVGLNVGADGGFVVSPASAAVQCITTMDNNNGAYSCFIGTEDGDELKGFADKENKNVTSFFMSVGVNQNTDQDVVVNTIGSVDTDNGYGEIRPATGSTLTSASFTSESTVSIDGMFFRGEFTDLAGSAFTGVLFANVIAANGNLTQFEWTGLPTDDANHILLGVDETTEPGPLLGTVDLFVGPNNGEMKSLKQIDFSVPGTITVPEPSTWVMMALGFVGLAFVGWRRTAKREGALA